MIFLPRVPDSCLDMKYKKYLTCQPAMRNKKLELNSPQCLCRFEHKKLDLCWSLGKLPDPPQLGCNRHKRVGLLVWEFPIPEKWFEVVILVVTMTNECLLGLWGGVSFLQVDLTKKKTSKKFKCPPYPLWSLRVRTWKMDGLSSKRSFPKLGSGNLFSMVNSLDFFYFVKWNWAGYLQSGPLPVISRVVSYNSTFGGITPVTHLVSAIYRG